MPKECTTHYHACDCREEMLKSVCQHAIKLHKDLIIFKILKECSCDICNKARILLDIPEVKQSTKLICSCGFTQSYPIPHEHDRTEREQVIIDYYHKAEKEMEEVIKKYWKPE